MHFPVNCSIGATRRAAKTLRNRVRVCAVALQSTLPQFSGSAGIFQGGAFRELSEVPTVLEEAGVRTGPQVSSVSPFSRSRSESRVQRSFGLRRTRTQSTPQQERARQQPPPQKMSQWRTTKPNEHPVWPRTNILLLLLCFVVPLCCSNSDSELVEPPSPCESCVLLARELQLKSQRIHKKSEAEFIDLSETICKTMLDYKVHKEVSGISRFAREDSQTMKTLKQLKDRGVKVELGMPYEMWDQPAAEVSLLRQHCDLILAEYEDDLSEWFTAGAAQNLEEFLCLSRYLKGKDSSCLHPPAVFEKQDL